MSCGRSVALGLGLGLGPLCRCRLPSAECWCGAANLLVRATDGVVRRHALGPRPECLRRWSMPVAGAFVLATWLFFLLPLSRGGTGTFGFTGLLRACLVALCPEPGCIRPARTSLPRLSACRGACLVGWFPAAWPVEDGVWFTSYSADSKCGHAETVFGCLHAWWWSYHFLVVVWLPPVFTIF